MNRTRMAWIAVRMIAIGIATYFVLGEEVVTADACVGCVPSGLGWACQYTPSGAYNCTLEGDGCLEWNYGCGGGGC